MEKEEEEEESLLMKSFHTTWTKISKNFYKEGWIF